MSGSASLGTGLPSAYAAALSGPTPNPTTTPSKETPVSTTVPAATNFQSTASPSTAYLALAAASQHNAEAQRQPTGATTPGAASPVPFDSTDVYLRAYRAANIKTPAPYETAEMQRAERHVESMYAGTTASSTEQQMAQGTTLPASSSATTGAGLTTPADGKDLPATQRIGGLTSVDAILRAAADETNRRQVQQMFDDDMTRAATLSLYSRCGSDLCRFLERTVDALKRDGRRDIRFAVNGQGTVMTLAQSVTEARKAEKAATVGAGVKEFDDPSIPLNFLDRIAYEMDHLRGVDDYRTEMKHRALRNVIPVLGSRGQLPEQSPGEDEAMRKAREVAATAKGVKKSIVFDTSMASKSGVDLSMISPEDAEAAAAAIAAGEGRAVAGRAGERGAFGMPRVASPGRGRRTLGFPCSDYNGNYILKRYGGKFPEGCRMKNYGKKGLDYSTRK